MSNSSPALRRFGIAVCALALALGFGLSVRHFYFLNDDSYISFRYAAHLANGLGLVWNPGERVEGYTNFLWVVILAAGMKLGAAPEVLSTSLGIASGVGVLALVLRFQAARRSLTDPFAWLPLVLLVSSRSFTAWCTSGLETMFFTALLLAAHLAFLREQRRATAVPLGSACLFALATLTRPDGALSIFVAGLFFLAAIAGRRRSLRSGLIWGAVYGLIVGTHVVWRHQYYGYWLPNTFYAKVAGLWLEQSRNYFHLFHRYYAAGWFLPFVFLALAGRFRAEARYFVSIVAINVLYILYVGGDRFEFRFLTVVLPYYYWLSSEGIAGSAGWLGKRGRYPAAALGLALVVCTLVGSARHIPRQESYEIAGIDEMRRYAKRRASQGIYLRSLIDLNVLPRELTLATGGAGALPYFTEWEVVDRRGLNDVYIAHLPLEERGKIAHEHDAPYEYLVERKVAVFDVLNQLVHDDDRGTRRGKKYYHDGRELEMRAIPLGPKFLVFATFLPDEELAALFRGHQILAPRGGR